MQKLSRAHIDALTDEEIFNLTIEHPEHSGERVFSFKVGDFENREEMAACMALLITRLKAIQK